MGGLAAHEGGGGAGSDGERPSLIQYQVASRETFADTSPAASRESAASTPTRLLLNPKP